MDVSMKGILFIIGTILILSEPSYANIAGLVCLLGASELPAMLWARLSPPKKAGRLVMGGER